MTKTISNRQLFFILFLGLTTVSLVTIPKTMAESAGVGGWLTILVTAVIFGLMVIIIVKLNNMFQGKVLFEYSQEITGKLSSYVIAIIYLAYFLIYTIYLNIFVSSIIKSNFLLKTPPWATLFLTTAICGYGAYKGVRNIARLFEIYGVILLITVLIVHFLMLMQGHIEHIRPLFVISETPQYLKAIRYMILPFLGIELLTVIPFTPQNGKKAVRTAFFSILVIGVIYVIAAETSIMMIGANEVIFYKDPVITAIRLVELKKIEFLRRIDIIYLLIGFMGVQSGIMMTYNGAVEYAHHFFPKTKRVLTVIVLGLVIFAGGLVAMNITNFSKWFEEYIIYPGLVTSAFIPIVLFLIAKVRKHETKKSKKSADYSDFTV